jgi:hypothetical protein
MNFIEFWTKNTAPDSSRAGLKSIGPYPDMAQLKTSYWVLYRGFGEMQAPTRFTKPHPQCTTRTLPSQEEKSYTVKRKNSNAQELRTTWVIFDD